MWVGCGDKDPMYVVADGDGRLRAVDPGIGLAGEPSELILFGDRLLVAGGEIGVRVAGGAAGRGRWSRTSTVGLASRSSGAGSGSRSTGL